jgi:hypothetical protein
MMGSIDSELDLVQGALWDGIRRWTADGRTNEGRHNLGFVVFLGYSRATYQDVKAIAISRTTDFWDMQSPKNATTGVHYG